ncbi:hypothetical protein Agabi119p4_5180 [Agaricus bisporus var. burnettii]|uniref:DUF6534 domain-containing protein n=1 Tax=Agaricus bisporus var. burnettii TaxID=192524 RepID=A0A8H7F4T1_AGABI|nr:hypothetical protein Agabi119p4_5180 [Agaricus bisporus var. burnettii]
MTSIVGFMWLTIPLSSALGIVIVLALAQRGSGIVSATSFGAQVASIPAAVMAWGPAGMICDLVIAVYMSWFLTKQMRRLFRKTQVTITRIKRLLLETGILTAALATAYALLLGFERSNACVNPGLNLGKIYSNSILVLLNNRFTIVGGRNELPAFEYEAISYQFSDIPRRKSVEHDIREQDQTG